jgi:hypothetical protein
MTSTRRGSNKGKNVKKEFFVLTCLGCKPHTDERSGILIAVKCFKFEVRRLREKERERHVMCSERIEEREKQWRRETF